MSVIDRLKKYVGLDKDKQKCPPNPNITVREAIEIANHIEEIAANARRYELLRRWYLSGGKRADIDPFGHIRVTTNEIFDAGVDSLELKFSVEDQVVSSEKNT